LDLRVGPAKESHHHAPLCAKLGSSKVSALIGGPRPKVYQAFLDPAAVVRWLPPDAMSRRVHRFELREGGFFRISLIYRDPTKSLRSKTARATATKVDS
jgi:uncharacterized protein YndB with AHSA1/START domain